MNGKIEGNPPVHEVCTAFWVDDDIFGFDISMDDPLFVNRSKGTQKLDYDIYAFVVVVETMQCFVAISKFLNDRFESLNVFHIYLLNKCWFRS